MSNERDGGPLYPSFVNYIADREDSKGQVRIITAQPTGGGLTIRDYFAAKASEGAADVLCDMMMMPEDPMKSWDPVAALEEARRHAVVHATVAYVYADAMLEAREKVLRTREAK